jgi:transcription elongation GreA/GreB family factor
LTSTRPGLADGGELVADKRRRGIRGHENPLPGEREKIAAAARELRYRTARRASAEVEPPPADCSQVRFGCRVAILRDDGRRQTFRIVGEDEADAKAGLISYVSPLARALIGRAVGDVVEAGAGEAEVVEIEV